MKRIKRWLWWLAGRIAHVERVSVRKDTHKLTYAVNGKFVHYEKNGRILIGDERSRSEANRKLADIFDRIDRRHGPGRGKGGKG